MPSDSRGGALRYPPKAVRGIARFAAVGMVFGAARFREETIIASILTARFEVAYPTGTRR